jgi:hypothetical protein
MAEVKLGQHVLPLTPVSIPRARRGIARAFDAAGGSFTTLDGSAPTGDVLASLGAAGEHVLYDLLCTVIPGLKARMPLYEFRGFASKDAMEADAYDEDADQAPTSAQVQEALSQAWEVSQLGRWISPLASIVDPTVLRAVVTGVLEDLAKAASSITSQSSSGASVPTSGSPTLAAVSPPNGSTGSSPVAASI